jgi:muramoyltetrapeptide carboxypeptidase LdcA involved in peptidoglycan recycling
MRLKIAALLACAAVATTAVALAQTSASPAPSPAATLVPIVAPSGPPAPDAVQKTITALYALNCTAALDPSDANLNAMFAVLSPEFVSTDPVGNKHTRDDVIANAKQQLKTFHGTDCNTSFDSMTATDPNTVVVLATQKITGDIQTPDGKHDIDFTGKSQDTWKLQGTTWVDTASQDIHVLVKIDGNVVQDTGGN